MDKPSDPSADLQRLKALCADLPSAASLLPDDISPLHAASEVARRFNRIAAALPVLIEFSEAMLAAIPAEHGDSCPRKYGYDHMRCRCEKDYMDEAAARLAEGLR